MIPCDPPSLGGKLADAFQSACFDKTDKFSIRQARLALHIPYTRILSANAVYPQQLGIRRTLNGAELGFLFDFGGDGDAGKISVDWHKFAMPVTAPLNYIFTALSWHAGRSRGANGFNLTGSIHEHGLHFRIGIDDAGRWAHGGTPDGNFNDYITEFALLLPGQPNWLVQVQREAIVIL